jgi:DNA polymerase-1
MMSQAREHFAEDFAFNPSSPMHVSALLFGGDYKVVRDIRQLDAEGKPVKYAGGQKAGLVKTRKETVVLTTKGFGINAVKLKIPHSESRGYSTADEHLGKIDHPFVKLMQRMRELSKDAETYYRGYSALVWPDGMIHPNYNNEIAITGRQTCSAPNLQNTAGHED